jgi:hypothetical protein
VSAQRSQRLADIGRIEAGLGGKRRQQALIAGQIVQNADQEARLLGSSANLGRADAGDGKEAPKPLAVPGNEGKRLNCQRFRRFLG